MEWVQVRTTRQARVLDEWSLVLSAADIAHTSTKRRGRYILRVEAARAEEAVDTLADYDRERRQRAPSIWTNRVWAEDVGTANAAWLCASSLLIAHMFFSATESESSWIEHGAAKATAIRAGETWRCLTALTLHADAGHVGSNTLSTLLFLTPICRLLGGGTAFALTLSCGAIATLVSGLTRHAGYSGIGASTAVFAAVGILGGLRIRADAPTPMWRRIRPLGAVVAILAMLGASPETDVTAHSLGLLCGVAGGFAFTQLRNEPFEPQIDRWIGIAASLSIAVAWIVAVHY